MPGESIVSAVPMALRAAITQLCTGALACALGLLALAGCSSVPKVDRQANASEAIPLSESTTLGRIASSYRPAPDQSGFRLMPLGKFSLDTRVQLANRAEVSLDV